MTSSPSKRKGTRFETAVVRYLQSAGMRAARRNAASPQDIGDIGGVDGWAIQCKDQKTWRINTWIEETAQQAERGGAENYVLICKRSGASIGEALCVLPMRMLVQLMQSQSSDPKGRSA
jgi:Holliday junction resolvase